jgi:hypothetical protein
MLQELVAGFVECADLLSGRAVLSYDRGGSLAPPCDAITGFLRSARRRRHASSDGPDEACQLTGDYRRLKRKAALSLALRCGLEITRTFLIKVFSCV